MEKIKQIAGVLEIDFMELLSYGEKYLYIAQNGDNSNHVNIYNGGTTSKDLTQQIEKLHLLLTTKDEQITSLAAQLQDKEARLLTTEKYVKTLEKLVEKYESK